MPEDTVFDRILRGEIPADIIYEDRHCIAFRDIQPQAPVHVLVIPRLRLEGLQHAGEEHSECLGQLLVAAGKVATLEGIDTSGYRCVVNAGDDGGQEVPYLHVHVLGGRRLAWPPG
ncbi:MAG TPA: histidine triad nucleotide-binding protein [Candidatus Latescibacteria bacterium]|jgi:histidine triad (HIT) family protein|nr:histidine triad nucleotide-binding protein [Gemmatimonadaceae bacterium]MDP6017774.1 histidine triad nucleotide-binding protein [Candidatus Latescibacterota bacterium]HJP32974.1 histidine triad nucleotide-binding protein [Candidatus Latescibacterota bacterium]